MPKVTKPMLTASYLLRFTPAEKKKLERLARQRNVSLAYALREGARLLLEEYEIQPRQPLLIHRGEPAD